MLSSKNYGVVDLTSILPDKMPDSGHRLCYENIGGSLIHVFVDKKGFEGGSRAKAITIKRFVPVSELLFEGIGLLMGDGIKHCNGQFKIFGFVNNNVKLHEYFLKFSKDCFGLDPELFRARVQLPEQLSEKVEEFSSKFSASTKVPIANFNKSRIKKLNMPCFEIQFHSIILGTIIQLLVKYLYHEMTSNEEFAASFLRGMIASEGCIILDRNSRFKGITIAAKEIKERDFIRRLLLSLKILPGKDGQITVTITGMSNFKTMEKWRLCDLHSDKKRKFETGMSNSKQFSLKKGEGRLRVLGVLSQAPATIMDLKAMLNRGNSVTYHLLILQKHGLVRVVGRINNKSKVWEITQHGKNVLGTDNMQEKLTFLSNLSLNCIVE